MTDEELARSVTSELFWDPRIASAAIAVSANDGTVVLRGTVGSFHQKRDARSAAERVYGVVTVRNHLQVRLLDEHHREDTDLRGDVLLAFMLDAHVPTSIDATVKDGFVTLTGTAEWQHQREEAAQVAGNVPGVTAVDDHVCLTSPTLAANDVEHAIRKTLRRNAALHAHYLAVEASHRTVKLIGTVGSCSEHRAALAATWAAPGITKIEDHITVRYRT